MGKLIDLFWKKEATTILIPGAIYVENDLLDEFEIRPITLLNERVLGRLDVTDAERENGNYYVIWKQPDFRTTSWLSRFKEDERSTHKIIRKLNPKEQEPTIQPLEKFGTQTAQDEKESLYEVVTNIEEDTRVEQEVYYDYTLQDIMDEWVMSEEQIEEIRNLDIKEEINIIIGTGLDFMTVTKIKQGADDLSPGIEPLDKFGKKVTGTGEMSWEDIQPGGEDYEWAKAIEDEVRKIEQQTSGKLKFEEMRPFDKYQGPYAYTNEGKVWQIYSESFGPINVFFIEFGMGFGANRDGIVGDATLLSAAINGEGNAMKVAENNRTLAGDNRLDEIRLEWDSGIIPLDKFGQLNFHKGDKVILNKDATVAYLQSIGIEQMWAEIIRELSKGTIGDLGPFKGTHIVYFEGDGIHEVYWLDDRVLELDTPEIKPLEKFGQLDFHKGDEVKVIHSKYLNPDVAGKIGIVKEIVSDSTILVHFDDVGRHIVTNKIVSIDLHFDPNQLEKVVKVPKIEPLTRFGQVQGSEIEVGDMVELKNGTIATITTKDSVLRNGRETFYFYTNESKDEDDYVWAYDIKRILSSKTQNIEPLTQFGKLSNRKAVYSWSFTAEWYENLRIVILRRIETDTEFRKDLVNELGLRILDVRGGLDNQSLAEGAFAHAEDINTVTDLGSPSEVWLDEEGHLTIEVPDETDDEKEEGYKIKPLEVFG